eukprot:CAMPEP_0184303160 /NCGR_PEP_ID=MMETSP1049-20130417/12955_1 /TAXON_ID=77928 /ORGANISM="Proteomonas sulcata, Strain CCMP704" /LENGTH=203 /DNA_ID=CAMNT_0026614617 /DNA_START=71 /DNA_END=682 /DNA_ORIENTATION=+
MARARIDYSSPIVSLDLIFCQAMCIDPILRDKAKEWALRSGGMFRVRASKVVDQQKYIRWDRCHNNPVMEDKIKWGTVKSVPRAIEKVLRSYGEDVSFLVDVARQSIVFGNISDLIRCIKAIGADEEVEIIRAKNRFDPNFDSKASGGFRNVSLNLRIVTHRSRQLGCETHVAELQLLLLEFAENMHVLGHRRYVEFRNVRGE